MPKDSGILPETKPVPSERKQLIQSHFSFPKTKQENSKTEVFLQLSQYFDFGMLFSVNAGRISHGLFEGNGELPLILIAVFQRNIADTA